MLFSFQVSEIMRTIPKEGNEREEKLAQEEWVVLNRPYLKVKWIRTRKPKNFNFIAHFYWKA